MFSVQDLRCKETRRDHVHAMEWNGHGVLPVRCESPRATEAGSLGAVNPPSLEGPLPSRGWGVRAVAFRPTPPGGPGPVSVSRPTAGPVVRSGTRAAQRRDSCPFGLGVGRPDPSDHALAISDRRGQGPGLITTESRSLCEALQLVSVLPSLCLAWRLQNQSPDPAGADSKVHTSSASTMNVSVDTAVRRHRGVGVEPSRQFVRGVYLQAHERSYTPLLRDDRIQEANQLVDLGSTS